MIADPGTIDEQPHWYPLQDNSGGLASLPMAPDHGNEYSNGKPAGDYESIDKNWIKNKILNIPAPSLRIAAKE